MLKKISLAVTAITLLLTTSCLGKVSQNDLAELVGNVFGIQSTATMMTIYGMPLENIALEMSEDQTSGTVTYSNFTIADFLTTMGASDEDIDSIPLSSITGTVSMADTGSMNFDLMLTGAVCETLVFAFDAESQSIVDLLADGKEYDINKTLEKLSAKREAEAAKEQAAAEAALPKVQTVQ